MMKPRQAVWWRWLAGGVLMVAAAGCVSTTTAPTRIHVTATLDGSVVVDGAVVALDRLPKALKSHGATKHSPIEVTIPDGRPSLMNDVGRVLTSAGYRQILFVTPRRSEAYITPADARKLKK